MDEWLIEKEHLTKDVKGISVENLKALHSKNEVNVSVRWYMGDDIQIHPNSNSNFVM